MTVDMLAATFFWPEGTLLGSHHPHPAPDGSAAEDTQAQEGADAAVYPNGFWSAVIRQLWRPSPAASTHTVT